LTTKGPASSGPLLTNTQLTRPKEDDKLAELVLDFLPGPWRRSEDRGTELLGKLMSERLYIPETDSPGAIKKALNEGGWVDGHVIAAGDLRQGKEPSLVSMVTGTALVEALRPRRSKSVPRHFVLALTGDRIVAFKTLGTGDDAGVYELWIRPDEFRVLAARGGASPRREAGPHVDRRHPRAERRRTPTRSRTKRQPVDRRAPRPARRLTAVFRTRFVGLPHGRIRRRARA
jgi:hypothetical protein